MSPMDDFRRTALRAVATLDARTKTWPAYRAAADGELDNDEFFLGYVEAEAQGAILALIREEFSPGDFL